MLVLFVAQSANAQLSITSFSPRQANTGDTVTILGSGFDASTAGNYVSFHHIKAQVISASSNQLKAIVPSGTSAGPIMVSKSGFSAISNQVFYPNVIPGNFPIDQNNISLAFERVFGGKVNYVQAADLDGDGWSDIIAGVENPGRIIVERNVSTADSVKFSDSLNLPLSSNPFIIEIADLNGDGKPDIVVLMQGSNVLRIFRNNCTPGNLSFSEQPSITLGINAYDLAIADYDGDGKLDITTGPGPFFSGVEFFRNNSTESSFSFSKVFFTQPAVPNFNYFFSGDFDNDGKPDLIAASGFPNSLHILKNTSNGPGNFSFTSTTMSLPFFAGFEAGAIDLNRDDKIDIIISSSGSNPKVYLNTTINNTIQFQPMPFTGNTIGEGFVSFTDLNGDGDPELMVGSYNLQNKAGIYENLYPALPLFKSSLPNLSPFFNSVGADFNRDGKTNLLISGNNTNRYQVLSFQSLIIEIKDFTPKRATKGTPVTVKGYGFTNADSVQFGGINAESFQVLNDSTLIAITGNGSSGKVAVSKSGSNASKDGFIYFVAPALQSYSPATGFHGSEVWLNGNNMEQVRRVRFGGVPADTFFILGNTQIKAIVGKGASGDVTIAGSDWDSSKLGGFSFFPAPEITGINSLNVAPGSEVVLNGSHFTPLQNLSLGNIPIVPLDVTPTTIRFQTPTHVIGGSIIIETTYGRDTLVGFYNGASINSVYPLVGKKGDTVTIRGSGFTNNVSDIFATIAKQKAEVIKSTVNEIQILVPSGPSIGDVSISMNGHTISGTLPFMFSFNGNGIDMNYASFQSISSIEVLKENVQREFKIADIDLDGKPDIIRVEPRSINVCRNTGQEGLISFEDVRFYYWDWQSDNQYYVEDINHDGKPDLIFPDRTGNKVHVFINQSSPGTISFSEEFFDGILFKNSEFQFKDIDKDGRLDMFKYTNIYLNASSLNTFSFISNIYLNMTGIYENKIAIIDIDNDGKDEIFSLQPHTINPDLVTIDALPGSLSIFTLNQKSPYSCASFSNFASDLNNDGKIDLVEFCENSTIVVHKNISVPGNIQFSPNVIPTSSNTLLRTSRVGDLNGDGKLDFVALDPNTKLLYFYINSSTGDDIKFLPAFSIPLFDQQGGWTDNYQLEISDFDNDGRVDIIIYGKLYKTVQFLRNLTGTHIPLFVCKDQPATLTALSTGSNYQWQQSTNGNNYANLTNGNGFSGVQSSMLNITSVDETMDGNFFRCLVNGVAEPPYTIKLFNKWIGGTNNYWSEASNWSCGTVPFGNIEVEIDGEVEIDVDVTIKKIIIKTNGNISVAPGKKLTVLE